MHDIVGTMFNKRFMEELFKPQDTYSKKAMRTVFDRLAHASIMRLNSASMDKVSDINIGLGNTSIDPRGINIGLISFNPLALTKV